MAKERDPHDLELANLLPAEDPCETSAVDASVEDSRASIRSLNTLLTHCRDASYGLSDCAEHAQTPPVREMLARLTEEARRAALNLRVRIKDLGGEPEEGGTAGGALHRGWLAVRASLTGSTDAELLQECAQLYQSIMERCIELQATDEWDELTLETLEGLQQQARSGLAQLAGLRASVAPEA